MIIEDWKRAAAREIEAGCDRLCTHDVDDIARILESHCPLEENVAYVKMDPGTLMFGGALSALAVAIAFFVGWYAHAAFIGAL